MKTSTKATSILLIFFLIFLPNVNIAQAKTNTPITPNSIKLDNETKTTSYMPDVSPTFYWWGIETTFGKNETKQIAQLILDHGKEGTAGLCATISEGNMLITGICIYLVNLATEKVQAGFEEAAADSEKTLLTTPYLGGIYFWTAKEIPEK